jgi:hypothetical protein
MTEDHSAVYEGAMVDVYAFGILMWAVVTRDRPYEGTVKAKQLNLWGLRDVILDGARPEMDEHPQIQRACPLLVRLMEQCWVSALALPFFIVLFPCPSYTPYIFLIPLSHLSYAYIDASPLCLSYN